MSMDLIIIKAISLHIGEVNLSVLMLEKELRTATQRATCVQTFQRRHWQELP